MAPVTQTKSLQPLPQPPACPVPADGFQRRVPLIPSASYSVFGCPCESVRPTDESRQGLDPAPVTRGWARSHHRASEGLRAPSLSYWKSSADYQNTSIEMNMPSSVKR